MTDDEMDARLHAAGAAWRAATDVDERSPADLSPEETLEIGPARRTSRRHRTAWLATAAVVAAVLVAGGGFLLGRLGGADHGHQPSGAESAALENTTWQLLGYGSDKPRRSSDATFALRNGAFVADDSCNLITGTARVQGDRLHLGDLDPRFYACTDSVGELTFVRALQTFRHDPTWRVDGDRLTMSGDGPTLHLAASKQPAPTSDRPTLTGATWRLMKVVDASGTAHQVGETAEFRIDGNHLHASDTCNTLDGTLQLDYPILDLDALSTTEIGCPAGSVAPIIDRVLTGKVRVDFRDATLTLTKLGAGTLTYRWQPDDEQATDPERLAATDWQLRSIAGNRASGITLRTADGRLELDAACARINVPATVGPGTVYASALVRQFKENECPPEWRSVAEMLSTVPALWRIAGNQLIVNQAGAQGYALVFDAAKDVSAAATELPGTWKLTGIEKRDGNSDSGSGSSSSTVSLTLTSHGYRFAGACGTLAGTAQLGDQQITFDDAMDRNDCWDNELLRSFAGPVRWILENGQLKLTKGDVTLTFER